MVSVKTSKAVAKDKVFDVMEKIRKVSVQAPVEIGDIIISDLYGADIIATKEIF
jgi:CxxC motif-containing protein